MIFRLRFKYKYMCTVIVFIVIFLLIIFLKAVSRTKCILVEPIDVVYTWVNGSDPLFIEELNNHTKNSTASKIDKSRTRYFDRYELKFSLRSLEKYAPWIRNVYIVTNGQIPYWLNLDYEKVYVVTHEDIFINNSDLPTFSSPAIETHLHRIPGLSKKFLYFNDDIYLGAPIYLDDFYSPAHGYLVYLDYPMQSCAKGCPWIYVHDGQCDKECNVWACQMDGGDCNQNLTNSFEGVRNLSSFDLTYLHTTTTTTTSSTTKEQCTTHTSQNATTILRNETDFKTLFAKLPPSLEKLAVRRLVDAHNRNKLLEYRVRRKRTAEKTDNFKKKKYFDAYRESLQHTNRLFNTKYGFTPRYVPAHMPFLIDVDVMVKLQEKFWKAFATTSSNRYRSKNDMQFAFSYYHFLMAEKIEVGVEEIFNQFDTDLSGTWSDREIRTLLTRMHDIPLSTMDIDDFDNLLINCSKKIAPPKETVTVPEYERYIDSVLPTIFKELVTGCEDLKTILLHHFGKKSKYAYEIIKNVSKFITFEMIESDIQSTVIKLDKIRKYPKKFVCLNDNVYRKYNESTINAIWYDFYLSLFPIPSRFELPNEYRNRFQYVKDLRWYQTKMTLYLYGCVLIFIYFTVWILCKNKFIYLLKNKLFC